MSSTNDGFHTPVIECICTLCLCYCTLQRRAARFVLSRYRNTSSVNSMLEALDRPTLERHRQISRLYMLYKIIIGLVRCSILKAKLPASSHATAEDTTGSQAHHCKKQQRSASFLPRTTKDWICLPKEVVEATTLDTFVSKASSL